MEVHACCSVCRRRVSASTSVPVPGDLRRSCFRRACVIELARRVAADKASLNPQNRPRPDLGTTGKAAG